MFKWYITYVYKIMQVNNQMRNQRTYIGLPVPHVTGSVTPQVPPTKIKQ